MQSASIIVDINFVRCGGCKVMLTDDLATQCPTCHAHFDRITSNHVGLATRLLKKRQAAGIEFVQLETFHSQVGRRDGDSNGERSAAESHPTASLNVDFTNLRCSNCKVLVSDELATVCPTCGACFDRVSSNHVGLASKLEKKRVAAGLASR